MSLTFASGKDNGILLDIGRNMEKLDGREKLFYEDQKGLRQGCLSEEIDIEYELAKETSERELLEMNEMLQKKEQYARCEDLDVSFECSDVMYSTTISNSTIDQSVNRSGIVRSTKSVTTVYVQTEPVKPEKLKLRVNRKICTDKIKATCANVSSVYGVSVEMSRKMVKTLCACLSFSSWGLQISFFGATTI